MLSKWNKQYQQLVVKTRFISQFGALWFAVISVLEFCRLCSAIYANYSSVDRELFQRAIENGLFLVLLFVAFGLRFAFLFRRSTDHYSIVQFLWICIAIFMTTYVIVFDSYRYGRSDVVFAIYDLSRLNPIIIQYPFFLVISFLRFIITAVISFLRAR